MNIGKSKVVFIDTPGFDDSTRTDSEILMEISKLLSMQQEGLVLRGIIYLHRISDVRMGGSSVKTLNIFKKICGKDALTNVLLVTTRWNEVEETLGASREQELREDFWSYMLSHGSTMARFRGDRDSAFVLAAQLVSQRSIVLDLQKELIEQGKPLSETTAGSFVKDDIVEQKAQNERELKELIDLRQTLKDDDRFGKRRVQRDLEKQKELSHIYQCDEDLLQRDVVAETRRRIEENLQTRQKSGVWLFVPLLPKMVGVLELFARIPPGTMSVLSNWLSGYGIVRSTTQFLSNFDIASTRDNGDSVDF